MLIPTSPKTAAVIRAGGVIDYSCASEGYITAQYASNPDKRCVLQVFADYRSQRFTLPSDGTAKVIPLCFGDGAYRVIMYRQISGDTYSTLMTASFYAELRDEHLPFLYPNTYCEFTAESRCVNVAKKVCKGKKTDFDKFESIYWYVLNNIEYDKQFAGEVRAGEHKFWIPNPDDVINSGKGICWGYASLTAAMCRAVDIPCKICVGYVGSQYHAWTEVYLEHSGEIHGLKYESGKYNLTDLTFLDSANTQTIPAIVDYMQQNGNYVTEYYG